PTRGGCFRSIWAMGAADKSGRMECESVRSVRARSPLMATVQEPKAGRYDSYVESELTRARRRIQAQDVGTASLGLLAGTLAYALGMVLLDRWLNLPDAARQVALFGYLAAAIAYT